jgi:hypothetical protein
MSPRTSQTPSATFWRSGLQGGLNRILSDKDAYPIAVPRLWSVALVILVACLLASMVIAVIRLSEV